MADAAYGLWPLVVLNTLLFIVFAASVQERGGPNVRHASTLEGARVRCEWPGGRVAGWPKRRC
ncbi:hypothetical protein RB628_21325 [Streptomyces sp. ADMS]|uniref:hypothetical protein n=1 Tax=Streptomyces sp. ADMS TaxID=3071415 RepID=UPI00296FDBDF|nr:hypothetical protein [Streptomyces sp. ADMS]MDW4907823.1 hypothetical protein [Streptomyces sp. ADMS]